MSLKYSLEKINEILEKNSIHLFDVNDEYVDCKTKIHLIDNDGYQYSCSIDAFLNNKRGGCKSLYRFSSRNKYSMDNICLWIKKEGLPYEVVDGIFKNAIEKNLLVRCSCCKNTWMTTWNSLQSGRGCIFCNRKIGGLRRRISLEKVIQIFHIHDISIDDISQYETTEDKISVTCKKCGYSWKTDYHHVKQGKSCPICASSHGERAISQYLSSHNILFIHQKKFDKCLYKRKLPFDFYIPRYNLCIEYQGEFHYIPLDFAGGQENLKEFKIKDSIKEKFCLESGIMLLKIPYWEKSNICSILDGVFLNMN